MVNRERAFELGKAPGERLELSTSRATRDKCSYGPQFKLVQLEGHVAMPAVTAHDPYFPITRAHIARDTLWIQSICNRVRRRHKVGQCVKIASKSWT